MKTGWGMMKAGFRACRKLKGMIINFHHRRGKERRGKEERKRRSWGAYIA
jgi:hypothetical protein